jgi:hypothetical protein
MITDKEWREDYTYTLKGIISPKGIENQLELLDMIEKLPTFKESSLIRKHLLLCIRVWYKFSSNKEVITPIYDRFRKDLEV